MGGGGREERGIVRRGEMKRIARQLPPTLKDRQTDRKREERKEKKRVRHLFFQGKTRQAKIHSSSSSSSSTSPVLLSVWRYNNNATSLFFFLYYDYYNHSPSSLPSPPPPPHLSSSSSFSIIFLLVFQFYLRVFASLCVTSSQTIRKGSNGRHQRHIFFFLFFFLSLRCLAASLPSPTNQSRARITH